MTLLYFTGFDEFENTISTFPPSAPFRLASAAPNDGNAAFTSTGAAYGYGKAFKVIDAGGAGLPNNGTPLPLFNLGTTYTDGHHFVCGFDYIPSAFSGLLGLVNSTGQQIMGVSVTSMGYLILNDASKANVQGAVLATAADALVANQQYYIEIEMASGAAGVGAVGKVWVNGELYINYAGNLTLPGTPYDWAWTDIVLGCAVGTGSNGLYEADVCLLDNFYLLTTGGVEPVARLGIVRVGTLGPNSEVGGQNVGYTRTGGSDVTDSVGSASNDGDTSYYAGNNLGDTVIFDSTDTLPGSPSTVFAILPEGYSKRTGATSRVLTPVVRDASANYLGAGQSVPALYGAIGAVWTSRPADGTELTQANVEALQWGVKITG